MEQNKSEQMEEGRAHNRGTGFLGDPYPAGRHPYLDHCGADRGDQVLDLSTKTTKDEHVLPLLAAVEESDDIDGLLVLLNTVGGDIEAGLAIAELISGMKKPTVSLVLGRNSIGVPLAVSAQTSFIAPSAAMTIHPVRMSGTGLIRVSQTFHAFQPYSGADSDFVTRHSGIKRDTFTEMMLQTGELAADVGSVVHGEEAVAIGLIDHVGGLSDALECLHQNDGPQRARGGPE